MDQSTHEIRVREWSQIIQDCNASGLTFKDPYLSEIRLRNNVPIVFAAESMNDYQFLSKYYHMRMNLYCDELLDYKPSKEEKEWLTQIFLPWGKEILCNSNLDITKKKKTNKQNSSKNSIEEFLNLFVRKNGFKHLS